MKAFILTLVALNLIFTAIARAGAGALLTGAEAGRWTMDFDAATNLARSRGLAIFLDFTGSDWCGWCKLMDRQIFSQDEWTEFAKDKLVLVKIDFPRDQSLVPELYRQRNLELQNQFGVTGYPTYVILDADGKTELGRLGASASATQKRFQADVLSAIRRSPGQVEQLVRDVPPDVATKYKELLQEYQKLNGEFEAWLKSQPEQNDDNTKKYLDWQTRLLQTTQSMERVEADKFVKSLPPEARDRYNTLLEQRQRAEMEFNTWLQSRPDDNQENRQIQIEMRDKIEQLNEKLRLF